MRAVFKDAVLIPCLLVSGVSSGILIQKYLLTRNSPAPGLAPSETKKFADLEAAVERVSSRVDALEKVSLSSSSPVPDPGPTRAVAKVKPRRGNIWRVGGSPEADTPDLSEALANLDDGALIELEEGHYELDLTTVPTKTLALKGSPRASVIYKHGSDLHSVKRLKLESIDLTFSDHLLDFIGLGADDLVLELKDTTLRHPKLTLSFRDQSKLLLETVELSGVALRFSGKASGSITRSRLSKSQTLITLADEAKLEVSETKFTDFENVAITSDSDGVDLRAHDIEVTHGLYAFWGRFNQANARITESKFHNLQEFTLTGTKVDCTTCEKYDIKR